MTSTRCGWSPKGRAIVSSCSCPPAETGMRPHSTDGASQPLRLDARPRRVLVLSVWYEAARPASRAHGHPWHGKYIR